MAQIKTTVTLDRKELDDAIIAAARSQLAKSLGGSKITYLNADGPATGLVIHGVCVEFSGDVKTKVA